MLPFTKKNLTAPNRVCLRLRAAREAHGLSLEAMADKTKINKHYLLALEECRFDDLPVSRLYQKNFIKKYTEILGIDPEPFISQFFIEEIDTMATQAKPTKLRRLTLTPWPNIIRTSTISVFALALLFYLGQQVKRTIEPPSLTLAAPDNGYIAHDNTITIAGKSEPEVKVTVNGQAIKSDEIGRFSEAVALNPGINTIVVVAQKKHGKSTENVRHIIYEENQQFSLRKAPNTN